MNWKKIETGKDVRPVIYVCEDDSIKLTLAPPYKSDPWSVYLTTKIGSMIYKDHFRLRTKERDENNWESIEDLEKAQEKAFKIMTDYIEMNLRYWNKLNAALQKMKAAPADGQNCP